MTISKSLSDLQEVLEAQGLNAALRFLNQRVPHRFTAVYRLNEDYLRRLGYADKEGGLDLTSAVVPFKDSFCELAVKEGHLVVTDSPADARLLDRPNPFNVGSYIGFPLSEAPGALFGTFCHYDTCRRPVDDAELAFLEQASPLLARYCLRTGMPFDALAAV